MNSELIVRLNEFGDLLFQHFWIPLFIWSAFVGIYLIISYFQNQQNPFFQYYLKLSLFFSLPIGLIISPFVPIFSTWLSATEVPGPILFIPANLDFSRIPNTFTDLNEIYLTPYGIVTIVSIALGLLILHRAYKLVTEILQLNKLRELLEIVPLASLDGLSEINRKQLENIEKDISVAISFDNQTPFTFGWRKPVIVIPEHFVGDKTSLNMMISHELIHIRRNDFLTNLIVNSLSTLLWFSPFTRILNHQINDFREITCDQEVITEFHASPSKYAKLIFSFSTIDDRNPYLQVALAKFNSNLTKRIKKMSTLASKPTLNFKNKISITLIATSITLLVACTETSSQIELTGDDFKTKSAPSLNFAASDSVKYTFYLDGEPIEYSALSDAINVNAIQSISIDNENGKKLIRISSNDHQETKAQYKTIQNPDVFTVVEKMPQLKGGLTSIASKIEYPVEAREEGIEGRVIVTFVVDENGNVQNPQIVRGIGAGCDEEALRVVKNAQFIPGEQRGRKVNVQFTMPIVFKLS